MIKVCKYCNKEFNTTHKQRVCCSRKCSNNLRFPKKDVPCKNCGDVMKLPQSSTKTFCNRKCYGEWISNNNKGENNPNYKGGTFVVQCSFCEEDIQVREYNLVNTDGSRKNNVYCSVSCKAKHQKETLLGENNPNFSSVSVECTNCKKPLKRNRYRVDNNKFNFCDTDCKGEYFSKTMVGENNPNFIHGLSDEYRLERRFHPENRKWRLGVFERDGFKCIICGRSNKLQAHHLNSYNWYIKGRTDVNNGVTLCEDHHKDFHMKYNFGNNTKEQFEEYLKTQTNTVVNGNTTRHRNA